MGTFRHYIQVGPAAFYEGVSRSQAEWEAAVKQLLDQRQPFLAHDLCAIAIKNYPDSLMLKHLMARALIGGRALDEAREILESLCHADDKSLVRIYAELRKTWALTADRRLEDPPSPEMLETVSALLREIGGSVFAARQDRVVEEETFGLLGRVYKDIWNRTSNLDYARLSRDTYLRGFRITRGYYTGINAASMSWLIGERSECESIARQVLDICDDFKTRAQGEELYWIVATRGEALLLQGETAQSLAAYKDAVNLAGIRTFNITSSLQQLRLMEKHGFTGIPPALFNDILVPPTVVVFAGHMIDMPDRQVPRFPPDSQLESDIRQEIDKKLRELEPRDGYLISYSSAACGSDILFIEAMLDRDAEVNIVLPFDSDDFTETSVKHAGKSWVRRFNRALKLAASVKYVTEERFMGDEVLFRFAGEIFHGYAHLRAQTMETLPYLLTVWDGKKSEMIGGTYDIVTRCPNNEKHLNIDISRFRMSVQQGEIDKDGSAGNRTTSKPARVTHPDHPERVIKTMLFADVVRYSDLLEEHMPLFLFEFLEGIAARLKLLPLQPELVNTWGDAIFAVMDKAIPMVEYAMALQNVVCTTDWSYRKLPARMSVRIALHAGPVFKGVDPITGCNSFFGTQITRAARIEPVTLPDHIYASEQFVAELTTEQVRAEQKVMGGAKLYRAPFAWEYVGALTLPKNHGFQTVYHLRKKLPGEE